MRRLRRQRGHKAVLKSRLAPPKLPANTIDRSAKFELSPEGLVDHITLVQGPAGFGKTTLLVSLAEQCRSLGIQVAWVGLKRVDGTNERFLSLLHLALGARSGLDAVQLLAEIARSGERQVLFLDRFEAIHDTPAERTAQWLIDENPLNFGMVISSRVRPGLKFSRHRLRERFNGVKPAQLSFAPSELQQVLGGVLGKRQADELYDVTRGWPAVVRLAREETGRRQHASVGIKDILAHDEAISDYIFDELLADTGVGLTRFLLEVSLFDSVDNALLRHVLGRPECPELLECLDRLPPLIAPAEDADTDGWQLAPILVIQLRNRFRLQEPQHCRELHLKASKWFASQGKSIESVKYAVLAGEADLACETVQEMGGLRIWMRDGMAALESAISLIPKTYLMKYPRLRLANVIILMHQGQNDEAIRRIKDISAMTEGFTNDPQSNDNQPLSEDADIVRKMLATYSGTLHSDRYFADLDSRRATKGESDSLLRGLVHTWDCIGHQQQGDLDKAEKSNKLAGLCLDESNYLYGTGFTYLHHGIIAFARGKLSAAHAFFQQYQEFMRKNFGHDEAALAFGNVLHAEVLYHMGHLERADRLLSQSLPIITKGEGWFDIYVSGYTVRSLLAYRNKGLQETLSIVDELERVAIEKKLRQIYPVMAALRLTVLVLAEKLNRAVALVEENEFLHDMWSGGIPRDMPWRTRELLGTAFARLAIYRQEHDLANSLLDELRADAQEGKRFGSLIKSHILSAMHEWATGQRQSATKLMRKAMEMALKERFASLFAEEGMRAQIICRAVTTWNIPISRALQRFARRVDSGFLALVRDEMTYADVTHREQQVLNELAQGKSNKEIALTLGLSEHTVKHYLKSLSKKFGVSGRGKVLVAARLRSLV